MLLCIYLFPQTLSIFNDKISYSMNKKFYSKNNFQYVVCFFNNNDLVDLPISSYDLLTNSKMFIYKENVKLIKLFNKYMMIFILNSFKLND